MEQAREKERGGFSHTQHRSKEGSSSGMCQGNKRGSELKQKGMITSTPKKISSSKFPRDVFKTGSSSKLHTPKAKGSKPASNNPTKFTRGSHLSLVMPLNEVVSKLPVSFRKPLIHSAKPRPPMHSFNPDRGQYPKLRENNVSEIIRDAKKEVELPLDSSSRFLPLGNFGPMPAAKSVKKFSTQKDSLHLSIAPKVKVKPPRVTLNLDKVLNFPTIALESPVSTLEASSIRTTNRNRIKLQPIQRNAFSSQGTPVKLLLPKVFLGSKTRPSSQEEDITVNQDRLVVHKQVTCPEVERNPFRLSDPKLPHAPRYAKTSPFELVPPLSVPAAQVSKVMKHRRMAYGRPESRGQEELCNVTFGEKKQWSANI